MRRATWLVATVVCLVAAYGSASPLTEGILGTWINIDPEAQGLAQIVILPSETGGLNVFGYGVCDPDYCDWGPTPLYLAATPISFEPEFGVAIWEEASSVVVLTFLQEGEFLVAQLYYFWTDGTGEPYRELALLRKVY